MPPTRIAREHELNIVTTNAVRIIKIHFSNYIYIITTNRPCEAVGVEEINGLVQNAKGLVYEMPMGS